MGDPQVGATAPITTSANPLIVQATGTERGVAARTFNLILGAGWIVFGGFVILGLYGLCAMWSGLPDYFGYTGLGLVGGLLALASVCTALSYGWPHRRSHTSRARSTNTK